MRWLSVVRPSQRVRVVAVHSERPSSMREMRASISVDIWWSGCAEPGKGKKSRKTTERNEHLRQHNLHTGQPSQLHLQVEHPHVGVQSGRQEPMKKAETAPCPQHRRCMVYGRFLSIPMEFICTNHRITHTTRISVSTRLFCAKKKNDSGRTENNKTDTQ